MTYNRCPVGRVRDGVTDAVCGRDADHAGLCSFDEPPVGTADFADYWERLWGRDNLDAITLRNLDAMRGAS